MKYSSKQVMKYSSKHCSTTMAICNIIYFIFNIEISVCLSSWKMSEASHLRTRELIHSHSYQRVKASITSLVSSGQVPHTTIPCSKLRKAMTKGRTKCKSLCVSLFVQLYMGIWKSKHIIRELIQNSSQQHFKYNLKVRMTIHPAEGGRLFYI